MEYGMLDNYKKPTTKKLNEKLTLVIYRPEKGFKSEMIIGLDHFALRDQNIEPILIRCSTLKKIVDKFCMDSK